MVKSAEYGDGKVTLTFDHVGSGLVVGKLNDRVFERTDDVKLARFAVAGSDGNFVWADAEIVGKDKVVLSADEVAEPVAARYAFQMCPEGCNLYSSEGLPATPFEIKK